MINMADEAQLKELMQYISANIHFPVLGFGGGADVLIGDPMYHDVAIGTVIPGWLYADGSVYNIADYPQLAAHYVSHHGAANFYGGNGTTTFAVPDLRGEFLRGTGTNGHGDDGGDGANVGVHQAPTVIPWVSGAGGNAKITMRLPNNTADGIGSYNADKYIYSTDSTRGRIRSPQFEWVDESSFSNYWYKASVRPTNTSYPIYIKATLGHTYSTTEQPVGTWIDGKPLYEKTIVDTMPTISTDGTTSTKAISVSSWNIDKCISVEGNVWASNNATAIDSTWNLSGAGAPQYFVHTNVGRSDFNIRSNKSALSEAPFWATIKYTKTTD